MFEPQGWRAECNSIRIRRGDFVVYKSEVVFACEAESIVSQFLTRIDLRELPVQLPFEFVVEDDAADLAANSLNFLGYLVVKAIEVGIMTGFLSFDEPVIDHLSIWNQILSRKKVLSRFRKDKDLLRVRLVPFDALVLYESLETKILDVDLHQREVICLSLPAE